MSQSVTFLREGDAVTLVVGGRRVLTQGWAGALETCRALDMQLRDIVARGMAPERTAIGETGVSWRGAGLHFRQELGQILVLGGSPERLLFDMRTDPTDGDGPSIARQVWSAWVRIAREAELYSRSPKGGLVAEHVARDAAILHRSGAPMGITDHPAIKAEAQKLASGDRELRRFMPDRRASVTSNGVLSDEVLGTPTVGLDLRTPFQRARTLLASLTPETRRAVLSPLTTPE
jgi:hypothetical protein